MLKTRYVRSTIVIIKSFVNHVTNDAQKRLYFSVVYVQSGNLLQSSLFVTQFLHNDMTRGDVFVSFDEV